MTLTGDSALWANFNTANRSAMLRSEMLSWPVTIIILVIAFGSLMAAGLPLLLTMAGLLVAAGALVITTKFTPVSIWALNFALMFALALGIDYALFLVMRFRSALKRRGAEPGDREAIVASVAETVDTAGKAVAFSALTVLASLAAILIVPSPAFRSMAFGIMLAVVAVLAATLTLLPAVLGKLGTNINKGKIRLRRTPTPEGEGHSTGSCIAGGSSSGATRSRPAPPPWSCCSWPPPRSSGCAPTCPPSPSCLPVPMPGSATTRYQRLRTRFSGHPAGGRAHR